MLAILEVGWWAAIAVATWLTTLSTVTLPELCFAIALGIVSGIAARTGRRALGASWRGQPRWLLRWPPRVVASVLAETVDLLRMAALHPHGGRISHVRLPHESAERSAGREAFATLALCATPGTMVADFDPDEEQLTVHVLSTAGPSLLEEIQR